MYGIEVKTVPGRWIKFRTGSRQGQQVIFTNHQSAVDYLLHVGLTLSQYRVVALDTMPYNDTVPACARLRGAF